MSIELNTSSTDDYKDAALRIIVSVQFFICALGLTANTFLIYVMTKNRKLRSCCGFLLLLLVFYDSIVEFSLITFPTMLTLVLRSKVRLLVCFFAQSYGSFAHANSQILLLSIGCDRFISIMLPFKYNTIRDRHWRVYILGHFLVPAIVGLLLMASWHQVVVDNAEKLVYCWPTDYTTTTNLYNITNISLFAVSGTTFIYTTLWLLIKLKVVSILNDPVEKRLFNTLLALILITLFGWVPLPLLRSYVIPRLQMSQTDQDIVYRALALLGKVAQASDAPVLYFCSLEFRLAMQKQFKWTRASNQMSVAESMNVEIQKMRMMQSHHNRNIPPTPPILLNNFI